MATFRAIHPFVRESAFRHGFLPVVDNNYKVWHPELKGKKAQRAFYKAFCEAARMPGVRTVAAPGAKMGRTLLFPPVPEERWEAARKGIKYVPSSPSITEKVNGVEGAIKPQSFAKSCTFTGTVNGQGKIECFSVVTSDDDTARSFLSLMLGA
jgi:hypothetical protein